MSNPDSRRMPGLLGVLVLLATVQPPAAFAQSPRECDMLRRLLTQGAPIIPPKANPRLPAVKMYAVKVMIDDARFAPIFGKPFDALSDGEYYHWSREVVPHCNHGTQPSLLADIPADTRAILFDLFLQVPRSQIAFWSQYNRSSQKLLKAAEAKIANLPATPAGNDELKATDALMQGEFEHAPGRPTDEYRAAYAAAERRILLGAEGANASRQVQAAGTTAADLLSLVEASRAAESKLSATTDPALRSTREAQVRELDAGAHALAVKLARKEAADYEAMQARTSGGLATLAEARAVETALEKRYGTLIKRPEFGEFNRARAAHRASLYRSNSPALVDAIGKSQNTADIDSVIRKHVWGDDAELPVLAPVLTAYAARSAAVAPFSGFAGGDYLDAIYSGNFELLRAADNKYLASYQKIGSSIAQEIRSMGAGDLVDAAFDSSNLSLVRPVITVYRMNYGQTSKACLRPGFKNFDIGTRVTSERDTPFGREIVADYGIVNVTRYPVNKEFIPAFTEIGTTDPDDDFAFDGIVNGGEVAKMFGGVRTMMARIPCGDARIARLERNLLTFFNERHLYKQKSAALRAKHIQARDRADSETWKVCTQEQDKLGVPGYYRDLFRKRCLENPESVSMAEVERWKENAAEVDRLREKINGATPMYSRAELSVRINRCDNAAAKGPIEERELRTLRCTETVELTDEDREQIKRLERQHGSR
jgi:hypothetical protein